MCRWVEIDDIRYTLTEGDIIVVPSWAKRRFHADEGLVLFSYSRPCDAAQAFPVRESLFSWTALQIFDAALAAR